MRMKKSFFTLTVSLMVGMLMMAQQSPNELTFNTTELQANSLLTTTDAFEGLKVLAAPAVTDSVVFNVRVPEGTHECWIVGNFNSWNNASNQMQKVDSVNYTLTIYNITSDSLSYKYLSGPGDWVFVESDANGNEVSNRSYQLYDVVEGWKVTYVPGAESNGKNMTFEITAPFNVNTVYVAGSFNSWNPVDSNSQMTMLGTNNLGKVFQKTVWVEYPDVLEYKFCAGPGWNYAQVQENNYRVPNPDLDTIRHRVFSFFEYSNTHVQPLNWNFSSNVFDPFSQFNSIQDVNGLRIMGNGNRVMTIDEDQKQIEQFFLNKRLRTNGPAIMDPLQSLKPVAGAIAFNVGEDTQIIFNALSDGQEDAKLFISNGVDTLAWATVPVNFLIGNTTVPRWVYRYQGPPTTLYMYPGNVGVNFYYVGVTDYRGLPYEGPEVTYTVQVPPETNSVFIAGQFNGWSLSWMERLDSVTFRATIQGATPDMLYKYVCGPEWKYVEVNADGSDKSDRTWAALDFVERWKMLYIHEDTRFYYEDITTVPGEEISITLKTTSNMSKEAIAYQFVVQYDPAMLRYLGYDVSGTISETGTVIVNSTRDTATLYVSFMTDTPFSFTSDLIKFRFKVTDSPHTNLTHCWVYDAFLNDQMIFGMNPGNIFVESYTHGDVDANFRIQAYDAALTLQYSVGKDPIPHIDPMPWRLWRQKAADVDGVEGITANDAALILQYSAWLIDHFPVNNDTTSTPSMIKGLVTPDITITRENNQLLVRSYGNLVGLNLYLKEFSDILGTPVVGPSIDMSAFNIGNGVFALGLAALQPPADGSIILTIPLTQIEEVDYTFTAVINTYQKDIISSKIATSTDQLMLNTLSFYPNPARSYLMVTQLTDGAELTITDISGRRIYTGNATGSTMELSVGNFANGVYTLSVTSNGQRSVSRFIKE